MVLLLALLKIKWNFFHGWMKVDRTLETQGFNSTEIKLFMIPHPPVRSLKFSFPLLPSLLPATGGDMESTPPIAPG